MKILIPFVALIFSVHPSTTVATTASSDCSSACTHLAKILPNQVSSTANGTTYWALQITEIKPACYVQPLDANHVAIVVKAARKHNCAFAIRGGGHSDIPGASNIADGITLDLGNLNKITVASDRSVVHVGAGNNWGNVYRSLDAQNLTVIGGRESSVGVAGLTLGGGISYFSGLHGFACDNVKNYEVVLSCGNIVNVNRSSEYADLYKALRGGGNNFGVVTRFDLDTYPQGLMRGGLQIWSDSPGVQTDLVQGFTSFTDKASTDPHASLFTGLSYLVSSKTFLWLASLTYTKPVQTIPQIYTPFYTSILNSSKILTTERITTHSNLTDELDSTQPPNFRNQFHTATFHVNSNLQAAMFQIFREEVERITAPESEGGLHNITGFASALAFQPFTAPILTQQSKRGGNVLGLDPSEGPLMVISMAWSWVDPADDILVIGGMQNVVDRSRALAMSTADNNKYVYMNYAAPGDDPVTSYGKVNQEFLQNVSNKYDPDQVFQKLVPGGFKLV